MTNERYILKCVFCFDKNYAKYCLVALFSLLINNHDKVKVFLLFTDDVAEIDLDNIQLLKKRFDFDLEFLKIPYVNLLNRFKISHHFTHACYLRLLLPELLPAEDKILYLDCDLIVHKSLTNLYATTIEFYKYDGVVDVRGQKSSKIDTVYK